MKQFSPFVAPFLFFKGDLYRDVARNWGGIAFWYLFLVVMIAFSLQCLRATVDVTTLFNSQRQDLDNSLKGWPHVGVKSGKLVMEEPSPHVYKINDQPFIVFDTSGKIKSLPEAVDYAKTSTPNLEDGFPRVLLTENLILVRSEQGSINELPMSDMQDMPLGPEVLKQLFDMGPPPFAVTWFLIGLVCVFPTHFIAALIYGVVGLIMGSAVGAQLTFGQAIRLAVVAMTPSILLSALAGVCNGGVFGALVPFFPIMNLVTMPVTLGLLYFAAVSAAGNSLPAAAGDR